MQHSYSHSKPPLLCTDWAQFGSANSASKQKRPKKFTSNKIILFVKNYLLITVRFLENTIICFLDCLAFITFWFILQLHVYKNCQQKHSKKHKKHYEIANCKKGVRFENYFVYDMCYFIDLRVWRKFPDALNNVIRGSSSDSLGACNSSVLLASRHLSWALLKVTWSALEGLHCKHI